ncbi:MAG: hypothetical protein Q9161_007842 [Pseudevernia consocians]
MPISYQHHYSGYEVIGFQHHYDTKYRTVHAESRYKEEIGDFDIVFGHYDHMSCTLGYVLSKVFIGQGRFYDAQELLIHVHNCDVRLLGWSHLCTLESALALAHTYRHQGLWEDAAELEHDVVYYATKHRGPKDSSTIDAMNNLAASYWELHRFSEAEELLETAIEASEIEKQILDIRRTTFGSSHTATLLSMSNYAMTLWKLGLHRECQKLEEQVVISRLETSGSEHPETLKIVANLAATYCNNGYPGDAEPLFSAALEAMHRTFTSEHPYTLDTINNLASVYTALRRWEDAMLLYTALVTTREKVLGPHHEDTVQSASDLAYVTQMHRTFQDEQDEQASVTESA